MPVQCDVFLRRYARFRSTNDGALNQMNLRLDDVNSGDFFSDGMLDLNTRIDFDEVKRPGVNIHQEFDGSSTHIACCISYFQGIFAEFLTLFGIQIRCRCTLDNLLVTSLYGAITFKQVYCIAVCIAENLCLDVTRTFDQFLQIDFVLAEGRACFAACFIGFFFEILLTAYRAHATTATTPGGLEHDRIANLGSHFLDCW